MERREVYQGDEPWPSDHEVWLITIKSLKTLVATLTGMGVSPRDAELLIHHFAGEAAVHGWHRLTEARKAAEA